MDVIKKIKRLYDEQLYADRRLEEIDKQVADEKTKLNHIKEMRMICQTVLAETQNNFKLDVEEIMTLAIQSIFSRFTFEMEWTQGAARSGLNFNIKDGEDLLDMDEDLGCSMLDIISFVSRPVFHRYQNTPTRKLIIIDEGMKWLGRGKFLERGADLIKQISHSQGYQIIFITHEKKFARIADKTFHVTNEGNQSKVVEINQEDIIKLLGD